MPFFIEVQLILQTPSFVICAINPGLVFLAPSPSTVKLILILVCLA